MQKEAVDELLYGQPADPETTVTPPTQPADPERTETPPSLAEAQQKVVTGQRTPSVTAHQKTEVHIMNHHIHHTSKSSKTRKETFSTAR